MWGDKIHKRIRLAGPERGRATSLFYYVGEIPGAGRWSVVRVLSSGLRDRGARRLSLVTVPLWRQVPRASRPTFGGHAHPQPGGRFSACRSGDVCGGGVFREDDLTVLAQFDVARFARVIHAGHANVRRT